MKKHLAMVPKYRSPNYEKRFKAFLSRVIYHFRRNINHKVLFQNCQLVMTKIN